MRLEKGDSETERDARDAWRRELNKKSGETLCGRCGGSGNEFVGVTGKGYWPCAECRGTGLEPKGTRR